jgi:hypothetical protein
MSPRSPNARIVGSRRSEIVHTPGSTSCARPKRSSVCNRPTLSVRSKSARTCPASGQRSSTRSGVSSIMARSMRVKRSAVISARSFLRSSSSVSGPSSRVTRSSARSRTPFLGAPPRCLRPVSRAGVSGPPLAFAAALITWATKDWERRALGRPRSRIRPVRGRKSEASSGSCPKSRAAPAAGQGQRGGCRINE